MKSFELSDIVLKEMKQKEKRLQELERKKRSALKESQETKQAYMQLVADGAEQNQIDDAYNVYEAKKAIHERYSNEHEIMSNADEKYSVTGNEFADRYKSEFIPEMREKHLHPVFDKLEKLKADYLAELGELNSVLEQLENEQKKADKIMSKKAFHEGDNKNILVAIPNIAHISNEQLEKGIIKNHEIDNYVSRYLL